MRVQIKQTTRRCEEEESLRYEAGLKQKVPPGSTLNGITFISAVLSGRQENLDSVTPFPWLPLCLIYSAFLMVAKATAFVAALHSDRDGSALFSLSLKAPSSGLIGC